MRLCTLVILVSMATWCHALTLEQETCTTGSMYVEHNVANADVILGGIFDIRNAATDGYGCGTPHPENILAYEAARWTIDRINSQNYVNGVRFGMKAYDTCYSPYRSEAAANDFFPQFSSMYCNETNKVKLGIVGALSSWTTKNMAELTTKFPAPVISPMAASPELSDKTVYPYFMRTTPSSAEQIKAMIQFMNNYGWERIVIVYADNDYGRDSMAEFVRQSQQNNVCISAVIAVPPTPDVITYRTRLQDIDMYDVSGAVIFASHEPAVTVLEAVQNNTGAANIQWLLSSVNMHKVIRNVNRIQGAVFVQPAFTMVDEFFTYFTNPSNFDENNPPAANPWFKDWFMETFQCHLQNVDYAPYAGLSDCTAKDASQRLAAVNTRFATVDFTIKAVYTYAEALRRAHIQSCGGAAGLCTGVQMMTAENFFNTYLSTVNLDMANTGISSLSGMTVRFDVNGDFYKGDHLFWNFNNQPSGGAFEWKNVGNFTDNMLTINGIVFYDANRTNPLPAPPTSPCPTLGCRNCVIPRPMVTFHYTPGDVVISGLFDIHAEGSEVLSCGAIKPVHALNAAAFRYALNQVKTQFPGILNGIDLGSLVVDLCDNAESGRLFLNNVLGSRHIVSDMNGQVVDPNIVMSVVGELDSTEALSMASMLGHFSLPYIESSATSVSLSDRSMYPTFSRAIPSDYYQMLAIVLLLKRNNWNYVQVIYSGDEYGKSGAEIIDTETSKRSICIAAMHEMKDSTDPRMLIQDLQKKSNATVVIAIVDTSDYRALLEAIEAEQVEGQFRLIGTETWGTRSSVTSGLEGVADGSITLDIVGPQLNSFTTWLASLNPTDETVVKENPFFVEWYQYAYSCYLDADNRDLYTQECNPSLPITQAPRYETSSYTPFMITATYAVARAIDQAIQDICGTIYNGICWQFRSHPDVKNLIHTYLQNSTFNLAGYDFKMMSGEGKADYNIETFSGTYQMAGSFITETSELTLIGNPFSSVTSQCEGFCSECVYLVQDRPFDIIEGKDLKIGVNFALNNPGNEPFICSDVRLTNGMQSYLAVDYALKQVKAGNSPFTLNNVDIGALLMDHCNSAARAYGLPSALYSGVLESPSQVEPQPDLNTIRAWMTDNTLVTEEMKDLFKDLNLPVISPMATSNTFLNEEEYPTFVRTIQGDNTIASAMAVLAKSLGLQYVTVIYSANSFGREGFETFANIALQEGVCIVMSVEMGSKTDDEIIDALVQQPSHVVITYLSMSDMDLFLSARGRNTNAASLVIITPEPYPLVYKTQGANANNVLSLQMKNGMLDSYRSYLRNIPSSEILSNPSLSKYYMALFQCNLPGEYMYTLDCGTIQPFENSGDFYVDNYVLAIINAVYTFVGAAHETLIEQCGASYSGVCGQFYSDPNTNTILYGKLTDVTFKDESETTFSYTGKEGNTGREILLYDGSTLTKVADFAGAALNILDRNLRGMFENTKSTCLAPCTECINNAMNFTYVAGDILLGGIFDVHERDLKPFSCGDINTLRGFQLLEAFHFALQRVNDKTGQFANVLKNVKLGGIGLDACQSAVRGGYMVSNIHNGLTVLERGDKVIDPDSIDAYIGTYSSDRSIYLARLMKSLKIPQISYGSTSVTLNLKYKYPYFLRTVPADDRQAMGMIEFLQKFDIRYVQVVHTATNYGEQAAEVFNELASNNKICVAQTISFPDKSTVTEENANDVVLALLQKPVANTVVIFADTTYVNELLLAIKRNTDSHGKFKFIGSDTWANNLEATSGVEKYAVGSVTFDHDVGNLKEFDNYLDTKTPANYPDNPWFPEYYEKIHNCYLTIPDARYPSRCSAAPDRIITSPRYKQDTGIIHVINAVYAAAYGIDAALKEVCGNNYTTVCESFKTREDRRDLVLEKTQTASFVDMSQQPFSFYERGDGKMGYVIYSINPTNQESELVYSKIFKYTTEGVLEVNQTGYAPSWIGNCDRADSCTECPSVRNLISSYMLQPGNGANTSYSPATLVVLLNVHGQGSDEYKCGEMNMENMINALSVNYMLSRGFLSSLPRFGLRALVLDNCDNPLRIDQDLMSLLLNGELCNENFDPLGRVIDASTVVGVETTDSRFVVAANRVTAPFEIQLLSSSATSTALSDTFRYPFFARTVPPDNIQMAVIADILESNGWSYVGVIYTLESYGINGYRTLHNILTNGTSSCIGVAEGVDYPATAAEISPHVQNVVAQSYVKVLVIIVIDPVPIMEAFINQGVAGQYVIILTDTWSNSIDTIEGLAGNFAAVLAINFHDAFYNPFVEYVKEITYNNRMGIPDDWFEEFYQHIHGCHLPNAERVMTQNPVQCALNLTITTEQVKKYPLGKRQLMATYAIAEALSNFSSYYGCGASSFSDCLVMANSANADITSRQRLFDRTLAIVTTRGPTNWDPSEQFSFELGNDRYWDIGYKIYSVGGSDHQEVGNASEARPLMFNRTKFNEIQMGSNKAELEDIVSECPEDQFCNCVVPGGEALPQTSTQPKYMLDHEPRNYFLYDDNNQQKYTWPIWAIAVAVLTCIGILVGLLLFFFFLVFYPVRGGTTILGFFMMIGMFGIYAINFAFFLPASEATCGAREFVMGVVYAIAFAPLLVKSVDNWRFKDAEYTTKQYRGLTSPFALVLIAIGIVLIQCIIPIEWLVLRPPSASLMADSTAQHDWMWCDPHDFYDVSLVLSFVFVMFLVLLTAIFAALSWDSDSNYFESRWIFTACVATAGCFLVWMVVSTNAGPPYRDPAVAIANFVNATCLLALLPFRKLLLLIKFQGEEEKAKTMPPTEDDTYSTVYTNQMYQPDVFQPEEKQPIENGY